MAEYRARVKPKGKDDGTIGWRVEIWQYWNGWIDALQGWFDSKEEAQNKADEIMGKKVQGKLL